jgi:hypothetical protein
MAARDLYHDAVVEAFRKDGWIITDDPLGLTYGARDVFVDLGLQRALFAAEKKEHKLAVEVKTFGATSPVTDLHRAIGQYMFYDVLLKENEPDRQVFLAVDEEAYNGIFSEPIGELMINRLNIRLVIFDKLQKTIVRWIS